MRSAFSAESDWDWRLEGGVLGVVDVAVALGFAFQADASERFDKSQLTWRLRRDLRWICSLLARWTV